MKLGVIGHGYVGLVTACVFADLGNDVWVVGHTPEKLEKLSRGNPLIYEPGLEELLKKNLEASRIHFTSNYHDAVTKASVVFIGVGTPPQKSGEADLSAVLSVAKEIGKNLSKGHTVVSCKSTVPVGTNKKVHEIIRSNAQVGVNVDIASCPEFLREGTALQDTRHPDRVVIGSESKRAIDVLLELHRPIEGERIITDLASAELIKYSSNAMLATKISFANMIAQIAEKAGGNVEEILNAVGLDRRIGRSFLYPGVGYGGSCLPKDVKALIHTGTALGVNMGLLTEVERMNVDSREHILRKLLRHKGIKKVAIWGLSFKPDTDDIREAPSLHIIPHLLKKGYKVSVYDPEAMSNVQKIFGDSITYAPSVQEAAKGADALLILTEWNEFKQIDLTEVKNLLASPVIIDGRNLYDPTTMNQMGFDYSSVGR
jgi:UDPglucose 6-dehydrogenase